MLIDRPPLTEGWHLVAMLIVGVIVVAIVHRSVKRRVAEAGRSRRHDDDADQSG